MKLTDDSVFEIGKTFKGRRLDQVPAWHLNWWEDKLKKVPEEFRSEFDKALLVYIEDNRDELDEETKGS